MSDLYQEIIIEEFRNPQNFGQMSDAHKIIRERNASCGDVLTIYVKLDEAGQKVIDIRWEGNGCAISMAAMSVLSAKIKVTKPAIAQLKKLSQSEIEELLGLDEISIGRVKCLMLGVQALKRI